MPDQANDRLAASIEKAMINCMQEESRHSVLFGNPPAYQKLTYELAMHLLTGMPRVIKQIQADVAFFLPEKTDCWLERHYFHHICANHDEAMICEKFIAAFYQKFVRENANASGRVPPVKNGMNILDGMRQSNMHHLIYRTDEEIDMEYTTHELQVAAMFANGLPSYEQLTLVWRYPLHRVADSAFHVIFQEPC